MKHFVRKFLVAEDGLTMVEYAVAGALVAAACVIAFTNLGAAIAAQITALAGVIAG